MAEHVTDTRAAVESLAARMAYDAGLGASEWEAFVALAEKKIAHATGSSAARTLTVAEARQAMSRWLRIRAQWDTNDRYAYSQGRVQMFGQLAADVDHSALLTRLLEGKEPLPAPPPTEHAYPVYPDA